MLNGNEVYHARCVFGMERAPACLGYIFLRPPQETEGHLRLIYCSVHHAVCTFIIQGSTNAREIHTTLTPAPSDGTCIRIDVSRMPAARSGVTLLLCSPSCSYYSSFYKLLQA